MDNITPGYSTPSQEIPGDAAKPIFSPATTSVWDSLLAIQAFILIMFFLLCTFKAQSAAKYWIGGGGTFNWSVGSNWSDGTAPVDGDEIYFNTAVTVIFNRMPFSARYNKLFINQSIVSFRPDTISPTAITSSTLTIGDTDPATEDFYIGPGKDLFLGFDWNLRQKIILTAGSKARIEGRLTIFHASTYNTDAAGAVTTVVNYDPIMGLGHINGRIDNHGACISNSPEHLIFSSNTRYAHVDLYPGSDIRWPFNHFHSVPSATWDPTSTCWIQWMNTIDATPFVPINLHQPFGNFIWDVAQKSNLSLADTLTTIKGNLNIINTQGWNLQLTKPGSATLNIDGSLVIMGDTLTGGKTSVSVDGSVVNILQNILLTNGTRKKTPPVIVNNPGAFKHSGGTVNISEGLIISTGCSYTCTNAPFINLQGNLVNNGSYISNNETVSFNGNGTSVQYIGGSKPTTFKTLKIDNSAGVILQTSAEVITSLTFVNGKLSTSGTNTMMILGTGASITGAGAGKYVNGNLGIRIPVGTGTKTFNIGDDLLYTPVTLTFSGAATNGTGMIVAKSTSGDHPAILTTGSVGIDPNKSANRYFTLTNNGVTFGSFDANFTFHADDLDPGTDPLIFMVQRFKPNSWYPTTIGSRTATTTQITGGSPTTFGDFQLGQMRCTIPSVQILTGVKSYCDPITNVEIKLSDSEAGVNYQLKRDGTVTGSPVSGGGSVISFGTFVTPGIYTVLATRALGGCYSTMSGSATLP